jgi:hypothetical protein
MEKTFDNYSALNNTVFLQVLCVARTARLAQWWPLGWMAEESEFNSQQRQESILCSTASRPALVSTQPRKQWVLQALSLGVKQLGCEASHSPSPNAKVMNAWRYTSTSPYIFMAWCLNNGAHRKFYLLHQQDDYNNYVWCHQDIWGGRVEI